MDVDDDGYTVSAVAKLAGVSVRLLATLGQSTAVTWLTMASYVP
jgi:hypothetical protein